MDRVTMSYLALLVLGVLAREACAEAPERVVGGDRAAIGEMPYQCSLRVYNNHICGASIISERHVVTAAHCVDDWEEPTNPRYTVVCGTNYLNSYGHIYNVKDVIVHPEYKGTSETSWKNDIAVIQLLQFITFTEYEKAIGLCETEIPNHSVLRLSGWGRIYAKGPISPSLLKTDMYYIDNSSCQKQHKLKIHNEQLCAVNQKGIGACQGDSGGPLTYNGKLCGIVSWVIPCAAGVPDVYTKILYYKKFIKECIQMV